MQIIGPPGPSGKHLNTILSIIISIVRLNWLVFDLSNYFDRSTRKYWTTRRSWIRWTERRPCKLSIWHEWIRVFFFVTLTKRWIWPFLQGEKGTKGDNGPMGKCFRVILQKPKHPGIYYTCIYNLMIFFCALPSIVDRFTWPNGFPWWCWRNWAKWKTRITCKLLNAKLLHYYLQWPSLVKCCFLTLFI